MLAEALSRITLLMRSDLQDETRDDELLDALTSTTVVLSADAATLATHAGQCAFISAAILTARSGHQVYLDGPNMLLIRAQPPLEGQRLMEALIELGADLLPGRSFRLGVPEGPVDLAVVFGLPEANVSARQSIALNATDWACRLGPGDNPQPWEGGRMPIGACGAGALAAGEAFKCAMRRLRDRARAPAAYDRLYAPARPAFLELAPDSTLRPDTLPKADMISGGAIANATLYLS